MPLLIYNPGQPDEKSFQVGGHPVTIGRADEQEVCIPHKSLSRSHARVEASGGRYFLVDLQSKNGSFVNGARVSRKELRPGDKITLGDLAFSFLRTAGPAPESLPPPSQPGEVLPPVDPDARTAPRPMAVRALTHVPLDRLLDEVGPRGALKVKRNEGGLRTEDKLQILLEVSKLLSVEDGLDAMLSKILDLIFQILDVDRGAILLTDPETGKLEPRAVRSNKDEPGASTGTGTGPGAGTGGRPIYSQNIVDYVAGKSVAALFSDAAADPRFDAAKSIIYQSIRSSMCVPLKPREKLIGVLYVDNLSIPERFSEEDLEFLAAFASQVAVAIENSVLYRRIEQETVTRMQLIMEAKLASLGSMVSGIAHEIKNPLNFINNFAESSTGLVNEIAAHLARTRSASGPGTLAELDDAIAFLSDNVVRIAEHGRRADAIINGMLLHARGTAGARETADLNALVSNSVRLACGGSKTGGPAVRIDADYDESMGTLELATTDMSRVFINVIDNALYAMHQKSREKGSGYEPVLSVKTRRLGDRVEVRIRDNGMGVPQAIADKVFNPFFTTKKPGEGTGLGLSLSHDIVVEGHHGTMRMESVPGEHTEFVITLPKRPITSKIPPA